MGQLRRAQRSLLLVQIFLNCRRPCMCVSQVSVQCCMHDFYLLLAPCHADNACHATDAEGKVNYFEMATNLRTLKVNKLT